MTDTADTIRMGALKPAAGKAGSGGLGRGWMMPVILMGVFVVVAGMRLPLVMDFKMFGFYDPGAALKADAMLAEGQRPTIDFAYSYGLLPLWMGHGWYRVFGRTPWSHEGMIVFWTGIFVWGMARVGRAMGWDGWGVALMALAMPVAVTEVYLNQTHVMEAALLTWALAEQARGRRGWALGLVSVCAFVKPGMSYVYGLVLVMLVVRQWRRERKWEVLWRGFMPAVVAGVMVGGALVLGFGWEPVWHTLVPLGVGKSYRAAHFGFFFGVGRDFWWRRDGDYFGSVAGFWIFCTVAVVGWAGWFLARKGLGRARTLRGERGLDEEHSKETLLCMAGLHVVFVCCFYAWEGSWSYYAYLLVMAGVSVFARASGARKYLLGWGMAILLVVLFWHPQGGHDADGPVEWISAWERYRGPETAGLWSYSSMQDDWREVRGAVGGRKTLWLANGDLGEMFPGIQVPESWFMGPAFLTPGEIGRVRRQIAGAEVVVRFREEGVLDPWLWGEFSRETAGFKTAEETGHFILMVRKAQDGSQAK